MKISVFKLSSIFVLCCLLSAPTCFAEESAAEEETVSLGTLASQGTSTNTGAVDVQSQGAAPGDEKNPIVASVSQLGNRKCSVEIMNISPVNDYSVGFAVRGLEKDGRQSFRKYFSASLDSGEKTSRNFSCREDLNLVVELTRATKR